MDWNTLSPKRVITKIPRGCGSDWQFNRGQSHTRRYPTVWRTCFSRYKIIYLRIGKYRAENVSWRVKGIVLPKSVRSIVIHCGTNNIDTSSSDEISLGIFAIARSISQRHPNIKVIVSELLPRDIYWSKQRVKIKKTYAYMKDYCKKSTTITFISQDPDWTLPENSFNMQLCYKDHLHLTECGNIKFSKLIIETLQDVLSPQSSSQLPSSCLSQSSWIKSPPPHSLPRSKLPSVQKLSKSSSSQSLSATVTPFNQKCKTFCLILWLFHQNFIHYLNHHSFPKCFPYRSRQLLTTCHLMNQLSS